MTWYSRCKYFGRGRLMVKLSYELRSFLVGVEYYPVSLTIRFGPINITAIILPETKADNAK